MDITQLPVSIDDPVNSAILAVSEDCIQGFTPDPFGEIAARSLVDVNVVIDRIRGMLEAGTIRRVRQTLMATNLAPGALVAWEIAAEKVDVAFDLLFHNDPFSGHVVIRTTDPNSAGAAYRLWTTLKVPRGYSLTKHCEYLQSQTGATGFRLMPAKLVFALGVGHIRRKNLPIGSRSEALAEPVEVRVAELSPEDWVVLTALKREFTPEELTRDLWRPRAAECNMDLGTFCSAAANLCERGVIGRFSTFLEHVKPLADEKRVTRYNGLFHWAVPPGREIEAGQQVGSFHIMTHAYWREGGDAFRNVNIMGVAHGQEKSVLLAHKAAMDARLQEVGIPLLYTNVFWGGRSEIKPSEISPVIYRSYCERAGIDPDRMRDDG